MIDDAAATTPSALMAWRGTSGSFMTTLAPRVIPCACAHHMARTLRKLRMPHIALCRPTERSAAANGMNRTQ